MSETIRDVPVVVAQDDFVPFPLAFVEVAIPFRCRLDVQRLVAIFPGNRYLLQLQFEVA